MEMNPAHPSYRGPSPPTVQIHSPNFGDINTNDSTVHTDFLNSESEKEKEIYFKKRSRAIYIVPEQQLCIIKYKILRYYNEHEILKHCHRLRIKVFYDFDDFADIVDMPWELQSELIDKLCDRNAYNSAAYVKILEENTDWR